MSKILVINGTDLNLLGTKDPKQFAIGQIVGLGWQGYLYALEYFVTRIEKTPSD